MITRLMTLFDKLRGGAWPPSARTVRRPVKSGNERDPRPYLPARTFGYGGDNRGTASAKLEEGVDDGRSVCPESPGLHAGYNGWDNGFRRRKAEVIL